MQLKGKGLGYGLSEIPMHEGVPWEVVCLAGRAMCLCVVLYCGVVVIYTMSS